MPLHPQRQRLQSLQKQKRMNQVDQAKVSHKKGTAVVKLNEEVADEALKKTVEDQGYQVTSIK